SLVSREPVSSSNRAGVGSHFKGGAWEIWWRWAPDRRVRWAIQIHRFALFECVATTPPSPAAGGPRSPHSVSPARGGPEKPGTSGASSGKFRGDGRLVIDLNGLFRSLALPYLGAWPSTLPRKLGDINPRCAERRLQICFRSIFSPAPPEIS